MPKPISNQGIAIRVNQLGKCYQLYDKPVDRVLDLAMPGAAKRFTPFWALKDASFEIKRGQTVGIIGRNGSGKSTLLEMVCDTLQASEGEVQVNGRIAALLELGAGFNPEFTGRENVYMNGAIMGIERVKIDEKFSEIEAFANIGEFINHPVKTYSSGMFVRLAFATAIHMDPDILIVDEALAVGDIRFQRKCFREFERFKREGKTILFVTHAVELIRSYCDSAIFLHQGEIKKQGDPRDVVHDYLNMLFGSEDEVTEKTDSIDIDAVVAAKAVNKSPNSKAQPEPEPLVSTGMNTEATIDGAARRKSYNPSEYRWGEQQAQIIDYLVEASGAQDPVLILQGEAIKVTMRVYFKQDLDQLIYGITLKTLDGTTVYGANTRARELNISPRKKGDMLDVYFTLENNLMPGSYFMSLGVAQDNETVDNLAIDRRYDLCSLVVDGAQQDFGLANMAMQFDEKLLDD